MVFSSGCYYGVLNVIDPTIQYDADGKVVGALRLQSSDVHSTTSYRSYSTRDTRSSARDTRSTTRDRSEDPRIRDEDVVIVETVESVQSRMDDSYQQSFHTDQQSFHPDVTYVSESDVMPDSGARPPLPPRQTKSVKKNEDDEVEVLQEPTPEPEPIPELLVEPIQESNKDSSPEVLHVTSADIAQEDADPPKDEAAPELDEGPKILPDDSLEPPTLQASVSALSHTAENGEEMQFETTLEEPEYLTSVPEGDQTDGERSEHSKTNKAKPAKSHPPMEKAIVVDLVEEPEPKDVEPKSEEPKPEEVVNLVNENPSLVDLVDEQEPEPVVDLVQESEKTEKEASVEPTIVLKETPAVTLEQPPEHHEPTAAEEPNLTPVMLPVTAPTEKSLYVEDSKNAQDPESMVLVVDYMDATPLFKTIQRKNWQAVLFFLRTGSFSFSPLTGTAMMHAVQQQTQTWVSKKDESGNELWRQLPLHAGICFGASQKVIEKLIIAYPEALRSPDCHGNLPLHLAYIFDAPDAVLSLLMRTFPAALHVMNFQGLQPIQCSNEIASETFQYNAELFGALSDYTRAVAENDPDKLLEQLQEVRKQLKQVNDTVFASSPPRKPEVIKEYFQGATIPASQEQQQEEEETALVPAEYGPPVSYGPSSFFSEVALGLCPGTRRQVQVETETAPQQPQSWSGRGTEQDAIVLDDAPAHAPRSCPEITTCRVMEYCPKTKTWKEVL